MTVSGVRTKVTSEHTQNVSTDFSKIIIRRKSQKTNSGENEENRKKEELMKDFRSDNYNREAKCDYN